MREAKRRYWDEGVDHWVHAEPACSAEDEYLATLEPDPPDYTSEMILGLSRLTEKQRWVIECHYGFRTEGKAMSVGAIAELMGVSHVSVVRLIRRAEERLAEGYNKDEAVEGIGPFFGTP